MNDVIKTLGELNRAAQGDLDTLRSNPYCPDNFGEEAVVFSCSMASGYVPWRHVSDSDEIFEITKRHLALLENSDS